jgi:hypothetical protein
MKVNHRKRERERERERSPSRKEKDVQHFVLLDFVIPQEAEIVALSNSLQSSMPTGASLRGRWFLGNYGWMVLFRISWSFLPKIHKLFYR